MDSEQARKKALMDWIVARIAGNDYPKPVAVDAKTAEPDKTAVAPVEPKRVIYWEKLRQEFPDIVSEPFVSELWLDAVSRQKEAEPQSGHVEPVLLWNPVKIGAFKRVIDSRKLK